MTLCGIYAYVDNKNNDIVYIGKDMNIQSKRRHYEHHAPSRYNEQPFNRILQNNPDRYSYKVLSFFNPKYKPLDLLSTLEIIFIDYFNPKFNFTKGGDGLCGYTHTEESKQKMSRAKKGKYSGENHPFFGKTHSKRSKELQSLNISNANNTTGFYRVSVHNNTHNKHGFCYVYSYTENGKRKQISSVDLGKLKSKVKDKGLKWFKFKKED